MERPRPREGQGAAATHLRVLERVGFLVAPQRLLWPKVVEAPPHVLRPLRPLPLLGLLGRLPHRFFTLLRSEFAVRVEPRLVRGLAEAVDVHLAEARELLYVFPFIGRGPSDPSEFRRLLLLRRRRRRLGWARLILVCWDARALPLRRLLLRLLLLPSWRCTRCAQRQRCIGLN